MKHNQILPWVIVRKASVQWNVYQRNESIPTYAYAATSGEWKWYKWDTIDGWISNVSIPGEVVRLVKKEIKKQTDAV